jgi:hypothetical protein
LAATSSNGSLIWTMHQRRSVSAGTCKTTGSSRKSSQPWASTVTSLGFGTGRNALTCDAPVLTAASAIRAVHANG